MNRAKWYPRKLADRAVWSEVFTKQALEDGKNYGLTQADIDQIVIDNEVLQYFAQKEEYLTAEMESWRIARDAYLNGETNQPAPLMPTFTFDALPPNALVGIGDRTFKYSEKIKASDNYTEAVGAAFNIISSPPVKISDDLLKPAPKATAITGWKVKLKVALKGTSGVRVLMQRDNDVPHWVILGNFPDGEIIDETPPLVPNQPETRRYKMIFLRKNTEVGESSDIIEATTHA
jgi:hypothetical protein